MTERLADINERIAGIRQIGAVVNAMRGIAGARARQARAQLEAVDSYAAAIAQSISRATTIADADEPAAPRGSARPVLVLFLAEQGFAGAFSERLLEAVGGDLKNADVYIVGSRGLALAGERGLVPVWTAAMPSHSSGAPKLADQIAQALYARVAAGGVCQLDAAYSRWSAGVGLHVERRRLFPLDLSTFRTARPRPPPLSQLDPAALLSDLTAAYLHAELCQAALHAFAAENEARMEAMAGAHSQIERRLIDLEAAQRRVRQEEITAEIIELAAGERASRSGDGEGAA